MELKVARIDSRNLYKNSNSAFALRSYWWRQSHPKLGQLWMKAKWRWIRRRFAFLSFLCFPFSAFSTSYSMIDKLIVIEWVDSIDTHTRMHVSGWISSIIVKVSFFIPWKISLTYKQMNVSSIAVIIKKRAGKWIEWVRRDGYGRMNGWRALRVFLFWKGFLYIPHHLLFSIILHC